MVFYYDHQRDQNLFKNNLQNLSFMKKSLKKELTHKRLNFKTQLKILGSQLKYNNQIFVLLKTPSKIIWKTIKFLLQYLKILKAIEFLQESIIQSKIVGPPAVAIAAQWNIFCPSIHPPVCEFSWNWMIIFWHFVSNLYEVVCRYNLIF